ncbi:MAG: TetR/AcrR family transcriptional regulator [Burkholderiaceae bacterium]
MTRQSTSPASVAPPPAAPAASNARTRILEAALALFRQNGYAATTVDDLCRAAGVTKGGFFHYFDSKEAAVLAAIAYWNEDTGALFAAAPYWSVTDPRERLLAYLDFRAGLVRGELPDFTCLLGTLAQETFASHPALQAACGAGIEMHAQTLVPTIEAARERHAPQADWSADSLARHLQVVLQGAFVLAKARNDPQLVLDAIAHLRRYVEQLLPQPLKRKRR